MVFGDCEFDSTGSVSRRYSYSSFFETRREIRSSSSMQAFREKIDENC